MSNKNIVFDGDGVTDKGVAFDLAIAAYDCAARNLNKRAYERIVTDLTSEDVDQRWIEDLYVQTKFDVRIDHA